MSPQNIKPLGRKSYGSIPHLPGSRLGPGEHTISGGQLRIATEKKRDRYDFVFVEEKLDGSNVGVVKLNGEIIALGRSGYLASSSRWEQHQLFAHWVRENHARFDRLLQEGERVCGEWLAQAHGTRYNLTHEPFVPFDLITGERRVDSFTRWIRLRELRFTPPRVLNEGDPMSVEAVMKILEPSGHGALDPVEGAVWRVERHHPQEGARVDFLTKFVRHDKVDGRYLAGRNSGVEPHWNWRP
jgi:hypothetical protein